MSYRYYLRIQDRDGNRLDWSGLDVEELYHKLPGILEALGLDIDTDRYKATDPPEDAPQDAPEAQAAPSDPPDGSQARYGVCPSHHMAYTNLAGNNVPWHLVGTYTCWGKKLTTSQLSALKGD